MLALLYDVHGNLPALEAVLADCPAERFLLGGDVVGVRGVAARDRRPAQANSTPNGSAATPIAGWWTPRTRPTPCSR